MALHLLWTGVETSLYFKTKLWTLSPYHACLLELVDIISVLNTNFIDEPVFDRNLLGHEIEIS